ncbi:Ras GTPase [Planoprotostelium fungivorum]|uniref:Ras GTPase n=1 Tax=Planoprotostelium fungivorum TaxID=1890364 RepID=A0A2P6NAU0_9EUKA|nr:Ras GTPase [Planoprotostelium fungivorum]
MQGTANERIIARDMIYKLVILGDGGVGKSALTLQLTQNHFLNEYDPTIENTYRKNLLVDDEVVLAELLDTAGQEEFSIILDPYIRSGEGFLIVYSVIAEATFEKARALYKKVVYVKNDETPPVVIVGNKVDLERDREVSTTDGRDFAASMNAPFFEASAKARINVEDCYIELVRQIKKKRMQMSDESAPVPADTPKPISEKKGCCVIS